ncbi:MAG: hypothetical protein V7K88_12035 [Nostoc sp.]|uniref:hypothetical protein n=1 Tax=Nostoc sp. TaxID=1180 RepID=UPI002FF9447E
MPPLGIASPRPERLFLHQDLRTGNRKSNHREASAPLRFPDLKQLARRREASAPLRFPGTPPGKQATRSVSDRRSNWRDAGNTEK